MTNLNFEEELRKIQPHDEGWLRKYLTFIVDAPIQDRELYGEEHHILMESLFPVYASNKSNLKRISASNHFIAHYLLYKACPGNRQVLLSFVMMFNRWKDELDENLIAKYATEYEAARVLCNQANSKLVTERWKDPKRREHQSQLMRKRHANPALRNPFFGFGHESPLLGTHRTEEEKQHLSELFSGDKGPNAKLTWIKAGEIREKHKTGNYSHRQLAREYGVGKATITRIVSNKAWKI